MYGSRGGLIGGSQMENNQGVGTEDRKLFALQEDSLIQNQQNSVPLGLSASLLLQDSCGHGARQTSRRTSK